jgi:hypothetical protein
MTRGFWLAVLIGFLLSSPLAAQGLRNRERRFQSAQEISSDIQGARFRWHSFYLLSRIEISDVGYNEEFYVPTSEIAGSGITFGISAPQKLYFIPSRKVIFSVQAAPTFNLINVKAIKNQWAYAYRGDAQILLNHFYFDFYGSASHQPRTDQIELNHIVTRKDNTFGLNSEFKYSSRTSAAFSAYHRKVAFPLDSLQPPEAQVQILDRTEENARVSILHHTFPKTSLFGSFEQSRYTFPFSRVRNGKRTLAVVGFDFVNGTDRLRIEAGPGRLDLADPTQKDFRGILGAVIYTRQHTASLSTAASFTRDVDFSIFANNNYYIVNRAGIEITATATRKLTLRAGSSGAFTRYDMSIFNGMTGLTESRQDQITFSSVGWLYRFGRKLRGGFDVGYYQRKSNFDDVKQNGIRYVLHLSFTP